MTYQALYREWRSQTFDDLVGQGIITQTLKHAIMQQKVSHAYLFTGPRGTGKTSAAKIFSKAINCTNLIDGEPCNTCANCIGITEGSVSDVLEIDAASNNGVEEIRDIRDKVKYAPTQVSHKVYIIDEVHMLSTGAFNALLKTLEEPPSHVIFILATTEPHKIPATIISRTQRFDFKRINLFDIEKRLTDIMVSKEITYDEQALKIIARTAEGGMRDALSILDQAIAFSDGHLSIQNAIEVTGSLTTQMMDDFLKSCFENKTEESLTIMTNMLSEGKESNRIVENLLVHCRDLLMYQQAPQAVLSQLGNISDSFKELSQSIPQSSLYDWIEELNDTQKNMRYATQATVYLEVMTVKLSNVSKHEVLQATQSIPDIANLEQKIIWLEQELADLKKNGIKSVVTENKPANSGAAKKVKAGYKVPTERIYQVLDGATKQHLDKVKDVWGDLLHMLSVTQRAMLKACEPVAASEAGLVVSFEYDILCQKASVDEELKLAVSNGLSRLAGYTPEFISVPSGKWSDVRQQFINQMGKNDGDGGVETPPVVKLDPVVEEAKELFGEFITIIDD